MYKKICSVLLLCVMALSMTISVSANSEDVNQAVIDSRSGVVRIVAGFFTENGSWYYYDDACTGTGFAIGQPGEAPEYFVTNRHVIEDFPEEVYILFEDLTDADMNVQLEKATVVKTWENSVDLAILRIENTIASGSRTVLPLGSASQVGLMESVHALGFPGVSDALNDEGWNIPSNIGDVTLTSGKIDSEPVTYQGAECLSMNITINHGNSGGPLLDDNGVVVGVNTYAYDGATRAISIDYVTDYLDENGFSYYCDTDVEIKEDTSLTQASAEKSEITETKTEYTADTKEDVKEDEKDNTGNDNQILMYAIIAGGLVICVGGILFFVLRSKKKNIPAPVVPAPNYAPAPNVEKTSIPNMNFQIRCDRGALAGASFPVQISVNLGRDAGRCQVVFPGDASGISGLHCQIKASDNILSITDLDSTYGTYLAGGVKMNPNQSYPLKKGDCFYLANSDTKFVVQ